MAHRRRAPVIRRRNRRGRRRICCFLSCVLITQDRKEASQWGPVNSPDCARAITAALFSISLRYWLLSSLSHHYCLRILRWWAQQPDDNHGCTHTQAQTHTCTERLSENNGIVMTVICVSVCVCVVAIRGWATVKRPKQDRWSLSSHSSPGVYLSFFCPSGQTPSVYTPLFLDFIHTVHNVSTIKS